MSVGAQVWKHVIPGAGRPPERKSPVSVPAVPARNLANDPLLSLVHQLFFPNAEPRRTSILVAAADEKSKDSPLTHKMAIILAQISGGMVGIIESVAPLHKSPWSGNGLPAGFGRGLWQMYSSRIAERAWQIPASLLGHEWKQDGGSTPDGLKELRAAFDFFLLSATVSDSDMPGLCNLCNAAVLVVTANATRREAALRAQQQLTRQGVKLLGTVLDQRTMPIPESIYRRL